MRFAKLTMMAAAALTGAVPSMAQTPVPVGQFRSVELNGGGQVTVRQGPVQRVTLLRGDTEMTRIQVRDRGRLVIDACVRSCRNYDLRVEIVTPNVDSVAIRGGGAIRTEGSFPAQNSLAASIHGGGSIDLRPIPARRVAASIHGGGAIRTDAREQLTVSINGGGSVTYQADPRTTVAINGGGSVTRAR